MTFRIKVSVIIPVFNTEKYLPDALNSIIGQTLSDLEIITIDDGSTDKSVEVLKQFASRDSRIRIFLQENKGQSVARNLGLGYATGEFIYFMDSDDILEKEALHECYQKCKKDNLELVFFDGKAFGRLKTENLITVDYVRARLVEDRVYHGPEIVQKLLDIDGYFASPCLYLVRHAYLRRIQLTFYPGIIHEDELFTFLIYLKASRVGLVTKSYFNRRVRDNSTMTTKFSWRNINGYYSVILELDKMNRCIKNKSVSQLIDKRLRMIIGGIFYNSRMLSFPDRFMLILKFIPRFKRYISYKNILLALLPMHRFRTCFHC